MLVGKRMTRIRRPCPGRPALARRGILRRAGSTTFRWSRRQTRRDPVRHGPAERLVRRDAAEGKRAGGGPERPGGDADGGLVGHPDDSVEDALLILAREKFGALPVLSGDRLVGIITRADLLNAFVDLLDVNEVCFCVGRHVPPNMAGSRN